MMLNCHACRLESKRREVSRKEKVKSTSMNIIYTKSLQHFSLCAILFHTIDTLGTRQRTFQFICGDWQGSYEP